MKYVYLPEKCVKCENDTMIENHKNGTMDVYCMHCDFILKFSKEEVESILNQGR